MAYKALPGLDVLNKRLIYDAETGILTWRERDPSDFPGKSRAEVICSNFNKRSAGKRAGSQTHAKGYWYVMIDRVFYAVHRIAWKMGTGQEPDADMDHINGDPEDNRLCNLRLVSKAQNNRFGRARRQTTAYGAGIFFNAGGWVATAIGPDGKAVPLGRHSTKGAAVAARRQYRSQQKTA